MRRICCDTAFFGTPIDAIYRDRELFAELITAPYLDYEPEWTLVGGSEGRVIGYLTGSVSSSFFQYRAKTGAATLAKIICKLLTGGYSGHPRSERFARWLLTRSWREDPPSPSRAAHFHCNIEPGFRWGGGGFAPAALRLFEKALRMEGVDHYFAKALSWSGRNVERAYTRLGFELYSKKSITIFNREVSQLKMVCMHKVLRRRAAAAGGGGPPAGFQAHLRPIRFCRRARQLLSWLRRHAAGD